MTQWHKAQRAKRDGDGYYAGVKFREHNSRKMDAVNLDRYYVLNYWWWKDAKDGTRKKGTVTEGVGWHSEGHSPKEAAGLLATIKQNQKSGDGPCTLAELRVEAEQEHIVKAAEQRKAERLSIFFSDYFERHYLPEVSQSNKPETVKKTKQHVCVWIEPVVAGIPMREIGLEHVKRIRANMNKVKRSPRTIQYVFISFNAIWSAAKEDGFVDIESPAKKRSFRKTMPKVDNKRERFLSRTEEDDLLEALVKRSQQLHDMAVLSIECGLRRGEIFTLTWDCVDLENEELHLLRTKSAKSRWVPLTQKAKLLLEGLNPGQSGELVFTDRFGKQLVALSNTFEKVVTKLGLNNGISDRKKKVVFHSFRHSYASNFLKAGGSLYALSKLMGHSSITVTERYGHLVNDDLVAASKRMEAHRASEKNIGKVILIRNK